MKNPSRQDNDPNSNQFGLHRRLLRESVSGYIGCENDIETVNSVRTPITRSLSGDKLFQCYRSSKDFAAARQSY